MFKTADRVRRGDTILDAGPPRKRRNVEAVFHHDVMSKRNVSRGKVHIQIEGNDTLWVCDAGAMFEIVRD